MSALGHAVSADHPCDDRACDIAVAAKQGYDVVAAWLLLSSAEDCPHVTAVIERGRLTWPSDIRQHTQWRQWARFAATHGRTCRACGTVTYGDESFTPIQCGGCLARLDR